MAAAFVRQAAADTIVKDSAGTDLSQGASWVNGVAPTSSDVAKFDATATPVSTLLTLNAGVFWSGLLLDPSSPNVSISGANLLTLGGSGIDLSSSGKTLTLSSVGIALLASQTWSTGTVATALLSANGTINLSSSLLTIDGSGITSLTGVISGAGGIEKDGAGTLTLAAINNYSGNTTINGGMLIAGASTTQTTALGGGLVTLNGVADLRIGINNLALKVEGLSSPSSTAVVEGFGGSNTQGTLTIDRAPGLSSTFSGIIKNGTAGTLTLLLTGGGSQTLNGNNTYTGSTIVRNGTLEISGGQITSSNQTSTGASQFGTIQVGDTAGQKGILLVDGGTVFAAHNGQFGVGTITTGDNGGDGAVYLNSGVITTGQNEIWTGSTGSGYFRQTGGTVNSVGYFAIGRPVNTNNPAGTGVVEISGGTFNHTFNNPERDFEVGAYDPNKVADATRIHGVLNVSGGTVNMTVGNFQVSNFLSGVATFWGTGVFNATALTGTDIQNHDGSDLGPGSKPGTGLLGVVNLGAVNGGGLGSVGGGTLTTSHVMHTGLNTGIFNFHGGTLKAATNNSTMNFMTGLTHAYVYGEGGTIDTSGMTITIDQALEGPAGLGLASIPLSSSGSGYISPPVVTILGGSGATKQGTSVGITASAVFDINTGSISGIAVTNPGSGLQLGDSVTITLSGGGYTSLATLLASSSVIVLTANNTTPNVAGNLTFTGGGTTILTGANSYAGTNIVSGVVRIGNGGGVGTLGTGPVSNGGGLVFNRDDSVTLTNAITGNGSVTQSGGGITQLNAANYTGRTYVGAGTLQFGGGGTQSIGAITDDTGGFGKTVLLPGTTLNAGQVSLSFLEVGGVMNLSDAPTHSSKILHLLSFDPGGAMNVASNSLIIQAFPDGVVTKSSLLAGTAEELVSGFSGGAWNGPGIDSSYVAAHAATMTLALIDNADGLWPTGGFDQSVDANSVIVTPALIGDFNADGLVNSADFNVWLGHKYTSDYSYDHGDVTHDGAVNDLDFQQWYAHDPNADADMLSLGWTNQGGTPVPVPEPASLGLLVISAAAMLHRRRARRRV